MSASEVPILPLSFYTRSDVVAIAQELVGKQLMTNINGIISGGMIVETEAYAGPEDRASHAYNNRRTARTEVMFSQGGTAYIYLCYGLHHLFNVVTNQEGIPHAVLIRGLEPRQGIDIMLERRGMQMVHPKLSNGPGSLAQALGIDRRMSGSSLLKPPIWIEDNNCTVSENQILSSPRVGVQYAREHALLPWRFRLRGSKWTSPAR